MTIIRFNEDTKQSLNAEECANRIKKSPHPIEIIFESTYEAYPSNIPLYDFLFAYSRREFCVEIDDGAEVPPYAFKGCPNISVLSVKGKAVFHLGAFSYTSIFEMHISLSGTVPQKTDNMHVAKLFITNPEGAKKEEVEPIMKQLKTSNMVATKCTFTAPLENNKVAKLCSTALVGASDVFFCKYPNTYALIGYVSTRSFKRRVPLQWTVTLVEFSGDEHDFEFDSSEDWMRSMLEEGDIFETIHTMMDNGESLKDVASRHLVGLWKVLLPDVAAEARVGLQPDDRDLLLDLTARQMRNLLNGGWDGRLTLVWTDDERPAQRRKITKGGAASSFVDASGPRP